MRDVLILAGLVFAMAAPAAKAAGVAARAVRRASSSQGNLKLPA